MARCHRCYAIESQWSTAPCRWCGFPGHDTRTAAQVESDARERHSAEWGWDHEFIPSSADPTQCQTCIEDASQE